MMPQAPDDLLAQWAGEEFVAAGRGVPGERATHRRRALFFSEILHELRRRTKHMANITKVS